MVRKLLIYTLVLLLVCPALASAAGVEMTVLDKTAMVEKLIYGTEQAGSLVERVAKLERDVYGQESSDALATKLDRIYGYMIDNTGGASFLLKLNGVEWTLTHTLSTEPALTRVENLEKTVLGNTPGGALDFRLTKLVDVSFAGGKIDAVPTTLNKDTLIKIKIVTPLSSKTSRKGDVVAFQVVDDVYAGGILAIASGAKGIGRVTKVEGAQNFGRDAKLEIAFDSVDAIDGSSVETFLGEKAKEETKSMATAAGASVAGIVLLGPIGVVGGAFVHGKEIEIPVGTQLYIQAKNDKDICGIKIK